MFESCGIRRLGFLLLIDALIFFICAAFFFAGKLMFFSSAGNPEEKPVFLPVIMYHSVHEGTPSEYAVTPEQVRNDLRWLNEHGYRSVTALQLAEYTEGKGELPEKPVLITLDDGFYNNLSDFLPVLEEAEMTAIVSIVGKYTSQVAAADPHVPAYSYLTWEDVRGLIASGRIEIGNHTYDMHSIKGARRGCAKIPGETAEEYSAALMRDVGLLQTEIHLNTGSTPIAFAYPFGSVCQESGAVLRECGIKMTLTCYERPNYITRDPGCLYGIFRYNRSGLYSTEEFMEKLTAE
jgi:peptidoglycan/xylan/chitin deacetylase (PgdA/CDA1 family)